MPKRFAHWVWRKKYWFLSAWAVIFVIWLFCTPDEFFDDPTCTVLTDGKGNILNARIADDGQWRFPPRSDVPEKFKQAILQFEDRTFYEHMGFSFGAFGRAMKQNIRARKVVSGGSTITMQVVRLSRKGQGRTVSEKVVEVFQATRMEWTYSKDEILAMYASNAPMGGNVVGIDAAAWRYFGRKAEDLSWAEASLLAVLPNAPGLLHLSKNRPKLLNKRNRLLERLYEVGIIDETDFKLAKSELLPTAPPNLPNIAPHVIEQAIRKGMKGKWVKTNLDMFLQEELIKLVEFHHQNLKENQIHNAAVLVLDIETGKVIAYVGNTTDDKNEHGNQVDIIQASRSTGSILKPFLYASMIEDGIITPNQLIPDVPMILSGYAPKNYDYKYDGVVPAHKALSRSLNVPIVKMLKDYGVQRFHQKLNDIGMTTINRPSNDYGLSLILGGAETTLWDLCTIYGNMAVTLNDFEKGKKNKFTDFQMYPNFSGFSNHKTFSPAAVWSTFEAMLQVVRPEEDAQWQQFNTSQKIAWKTGTSYGFRDAWAVGVTPKYVVGVWVGNAEGEGRPGLVGVKVAAPILFDVFSKLSNSSWFSPPYDNMESIAICMHSGFKASTICPDVDTILVPSSCKNASACPYHKIIHLDANGLRVNSTCELPMNMISKPWFVLPPIAEKYYRYKNPTYISLPPYRAGCSFDEAQKPLVIVYPKSQSNIYLPKLLDETEGKAVFEASHNDSEAVIYWHLDEQYIGETIGIHEMEVQPQVGEHILKIVDADGFETSVSFSVVK